MTSHDERKGIRNANYASLESPPEERLLHVLHKAYRAEQIRAQYQVGRYRLDFFTHDGTGWEVDGRAYHQDPERDERRDQSILSNAPEVHRIIRIPASLMKYYPHAVITACVRLRGISSLHHVELCRDAAYWREVADGLIDDWASGALEDEALDQLREGETFLIDELGALIGCPAAFVPADHSLARELWRSPLDRWTGRITLRTARKT